MPKGLFEPLNLTLSINLVYFFNYGVNYSYKSLENKSGTPYYLVAPSKLDAKFTLGDK